MQELRPAHSGAASRSELTRMARAGLDCPATKQTMPYPYQMIRPAALQSVCDMKQMPNKGVQGTLHKVSGPLTPDVVH